MENLDLSGPMNRFCGFEATPVAVYRDKRTGSARYASTRRLDKASDIAQRTGATVEFTLFGIKADGLRRHLADRTSIDDLRKLVKDLLGTDYLADWAGDRTEFGAGAEIAPKPL